MAVKCLLSILLFSPFLSWGKGSPLILRIETDTVKFSGTIKSIHDSSSVSYAYIRIFSGETLYTTAISDVDGNFSFTISSESPISIKISALGYRDKTIPLTNLIKGEPNIYIEDQSVLSPKELDEIHQKAQSYFQQGFAVIYTTDKDKTTSKITKKYGFEYRYMETGVYEGCIITTDFKKTQYIDEFNKISYAFLEQRNGKGWETEFEKEYNSQTRFIWHNR